MVEQAEEALRLATARNDAGTGTQLDVLSARTALTDAETTQILALHDYSAARAALNARDGARCPPKRLPTEHRLIPTILPGFIQALFWPYPPIDLPLSSHVVVALYSNYLPIDWLGRVGMTWRGYRSSLRTTGKT